MKVAGDRRGEESRVAFGGKMFGEGDEIISGCRHEVDAEGAVDVEIDESGDDD